MLRKNWYLFTPLLLIAIPVLLYMYYTSSVGYKSEDAIKAVKFFVKSSTRYPKDYTETKFSRIRPGLGGRDVYDLVGVPFERHNNDTEWLYALPQGSTAYYHERLVIFAADKTGVQRVKETIKRFHAPEKADSGKGK